MGIFNKKSLPEMYDEKEIVELEKFITDTFGDFQTVMHELVSPDIHVDIAVIPPADHRNYYTLVTMGMGAHSMNVPKELKKRKLERAEIVVCLPPDWNINSEDEKWFWPVRWLKVLARLPIESDTWLGSGHTVQNGGPFAENTKLSCALLVRAFGNEKDYEPLKLKNGDIINFYHMIPVYDEEMKYKMSNGAGALLDLFDDEMTPVIDINRKNYCV